MVRLRDLVRAAVPGLDDQAAARRVVAALSAVFFPSFFAGLYEGLNALGSPADRLAYVRELARQALAPPGPPATSGAPAPAARGRRPKRRG